MMKVEPVPLFAVVDRFNGDLEALGVYERLHFLAEQDQRTVLAHGMAFCLSAMIHYGMQAKRITVSAAVFAQLATQEDKKWALGCTLTICPEMPLQVQTAQANGVGLDPQIMALMQQLVA